MTQNQKRWLVVGIALNKILIPQIRPFVRIIALPAADEGKLLGELKDWETKGNVHTYVILTVNKRN